MLQGWKNMHPEQHYIQDHVDLYEHIDDPAYLGQGGDVRKLVRKSDRLAGTLVSSGDRPSSSRRIASRRENSLAWAASSISAISLARPIYWRVPTTTSRRRSKCLTPRNILARQRTVSSRRLYRAAISGFLWERAR